MSKTVLWCVLIAASSAAVALGAETSFAGGQTVALDGLSATDSVTANVGVTNLTGARSSCSLALETADGRGLAPVRTLTIAAHESRAFVDVLGDATRALGEVEGRARVTCDGAFHAFALMQDKVRAAVDLVTAVEADDAPLEPNLAPACPDNAQCYDVVGLAFVPAPPPELETARLWWPAPAGSLKRVWMSMDVKVGDWYEKEPSGKHLVYWFVMNNNPDMFGTLYLRGPGQSEAFVVHGLKVPHAGKKRIMVNFEAQVGTTYRIINDYNIAGKDYTVTFIDLSTGSVALVIHGKPNLTAYNLPKRASFVIDMGFPKGRTPHEVPSYGWEQSNVHIEAFMK